MACTLCQKKCRWRTRRPESSKVDADVLKELTNAYTHHRHAYVHLVAHVDAHVDAAKGVPSRPKNSAHNTSSGEHNNTAHKASTSLKSASHYSTTKKGFYATLLLINSKKAVRLAVNTSKRLIRAGTAYGTGQHSITQRTLHIVGLAATSHSNLDPTTAGGISTSISATILYLPTIPPFTPSQTSLRPHSRPALPVHVGALHPTVHTLRTRAGIS